MKIHQKIYDRQKPIPTIRGRIGCIDATCSEAGGAITGLVLHVSAPDKPTLSVLLEGDAPLELLNLLLAAQKRCPELFQEKP